MNLKLIACEILYRELCHAVARSPNRVDLEFLPKGLHDIGQAGMGRRLREALDGVDESKYDAILLGYALCSNGIAGLGARRIPLVVPRGHDCITFFLGGRERYRRHFDANPGTYYLTAGWLERGHDLHQGAGPGSMVPPYEALVAKYGEAKAKAVQEAMAEMTQHYRQVTFIRMGIEPDDRFERRARKEAERRGWMFEALDGDLALLRGLVDGPWDDERFLTVPPGHRVAPSYGEAVVKSERIEV
jgi:hypothetical protein